MVNESLSIPKRGTIERARPRQDIATDSQGSVYKLKASAGGAER